MTGASFILMHTKQDKPQNAAELVDGRHTLAYLESAVSGVFDVDRCDYLLRDAHATGYGLARPTLVPKHRYVSEAFAALENERLWSRTWQMACREEQIPDAGSHVHPEAEGGHRDQ